MKNYKKVETDINKNNLFIDEKKYLIETWGCQMNEEDSEKLSGMLKTMGYTPTEKREKASIIIFNTCAVRENAELKVYGNLGMLRKVKNKNPNLIIGVCGCMMQQEGMAKDIIKRFPFVDIVFGTHNSHKFPEYLNRAQQESKAIIEIKDKEDGIIEGLPIDRKSDSKALVTIMYGCNNFCTYCIVPYVRGRERSRKPEDIENEIKELVSKGYKEITLLGQNVNSYGKNLEEAITFAGLLRRVNAMEGVERIRFMSSHPKDLTDDVIDAIVECDKVCEQIHLPIQAGSTNLLKRMNRQYSREEYLDLVKRIKTRLPEVGLTTDLIIGFPGETEEEFLETISLISEVRFNSAFTYLYSVRKGTPAGEMENQIDEETKTRRFNILVDEINRISAEINKDYHGKTVEILVEGKSRNDETRLTGRTRGGKVVNFTGRDESIGKLVNVKITKANSFSLIGEEI